MESLLAYFATAASTILALLLYSYYRISNKSASTIKPPELAGGWPIIGHLLILAKPQAPLHQTLSAIADKYGPIFKLRVGVRPLLVVSTSELAKELFTTRDKVVSARPQMTSSKHLGYNFAGFGFAPSGPYWREIRKIATLKILSTKGLEQLKRIMSSELETSLKDLYKCTSGDAVAVELKKWLEDYNFNVILRMVVGKRYCGSSAEARRLHKATKDWFKYLNMIVARDAFPFLGWLDVGGNEKAMKETAKQLDTIFGEWLEEHKQKRALTAEDNRDQDFMDIMLSVLPHKDLSGFDEDTVNKATCLTLIAGASDTTLVTTIWALSLLLNNRHVLKKAQEELDICVSRERTVEDSDISKLVYLQAIVKETLRLYPAAPLAVFREFMEDSTIGGYPVRKGTWIMVNLWKIHTDPLLWPNPLEFKPERFLTTHKDVDVKGQDFELIPFGSGRKICPGVSFGLEIVHLTLARLVHGFEISTPGDEAVDMTETTIGATNMKTTPLELLLSPRLSPHLYA